jgi:hypothetical protein
MRNSKSSCFRRQIQDEMARALAADLPTLVQPDGIDTQAVRLQPWLI